MMGTRELRSVAEEERECFAGPLDWAWGSRRRGPRLLHSLQNKLTGHPAPSPWALGCQMQEVSLGSLGVHGPREGRCILGVPWAGQSEVVWEAAGLRRAGDPPAGDLGKPARLPPGAAVSLSPARAAPLTHFL